MLNLQKAKNSKIIMNALRKGAEWAKFHKIRGILSLCKWAGGFFHCANFYLVYSDYGTMTLSVDPMKPNLAGFRSFTTFNGHWVRPGQFMKVSYPIFSFQLVSEFCIAFSWSLEGFFFSLSLETDHNFIFFSFITGNWS